jgi:hypothetical protein
MIRSAASRESLSRQYSWFVIGPLLQLFLGLMVKLIVPAVGFSGLLPELVSAVDDLFLGGIFHFPAFKLEARPRPPGAAGKAVQATLSIMAWQTNSDFRKLFRTVSRSCDAALRRGILLKWFHLRRLAGSRPLLTPGLARSFCSAAELNPIA